jgi:hypothetical protein
MSVFASRIAAAWALVDQEFADDWWFAPMREVVNAEAEADPERQAGEVRATILQPGTMLGSSPSLQGMHTRASATPTIHFMRRGLLSDVRKFDRFFLRSSPHYPETGTKAYEVGDGPFPVGFGRMRAVAVEIVLPPDAVEAVMQIEQPAEYAVIEIEE